MYLQAKVRIGSCKGPIDYTSDQQVFHANDVPEQARERKNEVTTWAKSKILSNEKSWDLSTHTHPVLCEKRKMQNYIKDRSHQYQQNYRAESLDSLRTIEPIDKPTKFHLSTQLERTALEITAKIQAGDPVARGMLKRTQEMPVNPKLDDAIPWNSSTVHSFKEKAAREAAVTNKALSTCTLRRESGMVDIDRSLRPGPIASTVRFSDEVRRQKSEGRFNWQKPVYRDPTLDDPVDRSLLRNRYRIEGSREFKTDQHSGVWELNKAEGRYMWSDTGSYEYHSKGDVIKRVNPDTFNYCSPHLSDMIHTHH